MTKEPDKQLWESNYHNKSVSGIEVRDKNGKVVNFIAIHHDEILDISKPHRITIRLDENAKPILPPPQTFEEVIQAKRRQQMLLYGSGATSSSAAPNNGAARRAAAATRRAVANLSRRSAPTLPRPSSNSTRRSVASGGVKKSSKKKSKSSSKRKPPPAKVHPETSVNTTQANESLANTTAESYASTSAEPIPSTSNQIVTSMKDLNKHNPLLDSIDPKEVKQMLRSALPGTSIILPNGTVIRKSRRGGARAGAGRKRSRPLPPGQSTPSRNSTTNSSLQAVSSNSSFSSQA